MGIVVALAAGPGVCAEVGKLPAAVKRPVAFVRDVQPIFSGACYSCHGEKKQKNSYRLDQKAVALGGGDDGGDIVPGHSEKSRLIAYVAGLDTEKVMPPKGDKLTDEQIGVLRAWIDQGAVWPDSADLAKALDKADFWSFKPATKPAVPEVKNVGWGRTPIDRFILARLEREGLTPSAEADRRTLIRRVYFDLVGLPPSPDAVARFEKDGAADAYEKLVDGLLASPQYGERWARHWLDVVHFGETHGYDKDKVRNNAWPYRDYVIGAFNSDKPYSRFVQEQLAGDVLFPESPEGIVATGFIAAGPWDFVGHTELREGTTDKLIARSNDRDDMVMTAMSTFQSLTVHCARCHNHKFDPITQEDYYRLQAVFAGIDRGDRPFDVDENGRARAKMVAERKELDLRLKAAREALAKVGTPEVVELDKKIAELRPKVLAPVGSGPSSLGYHSAIVASRDAVKWVQVDLGESTALDQIFLVPAHVAYSGWPGPGFGFPVRYRVEVSEEESFAKPVVVMDRTEANVANPGDAPVSVKAVGIKGRYVRVTGTKLFERTMDWIFALGELVVFSDGKDVARGKTVTALDSIEADVSWHKTNLVDGLSVFSSVEKGHESDWISALASGREREELAEAEGKRRTLAEGAMDAGMRRDLNELPGRLAELDQRIGGMKPAQVVYAVVPLAAPRVINLLARGDVKQPREVMAAGTLEVFAKKEAAFALSSENEGLRRAGLAKWITDPKDLLTRRSIVNRVWQYHFGEGIVATPNDFGHMGSPPTHPELLDWLAYWFVENGESFKALHRMIMTSSVYRQSSAPNEKFAKIDGEDRLLWRMNRSRLDSECLHDAILSVSGKLDLKMGGPSVRQFFFKDDHSPVYDYARYDADDPAGFRRSIYRFIVRSVPDPFADALDCPDASLLTPRRNTTVTALQALALMNDQFAVRQYEHLAERVVKEAPGDLTGQIQLAYRLTLGRAATAEEVRLMVAFVGKNGLANGCRVLVNCNEFVFLD